MWHDHVCLCVCVFVCVRACVSHTCWTGGRRCPSPLPLCGFSCELSYIRLINAHEDILRLNVCVDDLTLCVQVVQALENLWNELNEWRITTLVVKIKLCIAKEAQAEPFFVFLKFLYNSVASKWCSLVIKEHSNLVKRCLFHSQKRCNPKHLSNQVP